VIKDRKTRKYETISEYPGDIKGIKIVEENAIKPDIPKASAGA
jgi:hypothetical protein